MKIFISNSSVDPIYEQIVKQIKGQIITGELEQGDALPSIRKLAKELQISVITSKRAYDILADEGFIDMVGGKGCFVAVQNKDFLREKRMSIIENKLSEVIQEAKMIGVTQKELQEMLLLMFEAEE